MQPQSGNETEGYSPELMHLKKTILAIGGFAVVTAIIVILAVTNRAAGMPQTALRTDGSEAVQPPIIPMVATDEVIQPDGAPTQEPSIESTPEPTPEPAPEPAQFSIAWISDTQEYTAGDSDVLGAMTQWITGTRDEYNTVAVVHTGDIVYNAYREYQWQNVTAAFDRLPAGVHILTAAGNHDFLEKSDPNTPYLDNRPDTDFDLSRSFDESGYAYYTTFTAGGVPVLLFSLSYGHEVAAAEWVNEICATYSDHYAIICMHTYFDAGGYSSVGKKMFNNVVRRSPNIRLVLCGHARGTAYLPESLDDDGDGKPDRTVQQMMMNTQDDQENGTGFLRILRFDPQSDTIEVVTYSPWLDRFGYSTYGGDRFGESKLLAYAGLSDFAPDTARGRG
jgi:hypothetical protein